MRQAFALSGGYYSLVLLLKKVGGLFPSQLHLGLKTNLPLNKNESAVAETICFILLRRISPPFFVLFCFVLLPLQTTPGGILTMVVGSPEHLTITAEFTESGVWLPA